MFVKFDTRENGKVSIDAKRIKWVCDMSDGDIKLTCDNGTCFYLNESVESAHNKINNALKKTQELEPPQGRELEL